MTAQMPASNSQKTSRRSGKRVAVGLLQMRCFGDPEENAARALAKVEEAARSGAQIICTQELYRSIYFCQSEDHRYFAWAEPIPGPSTAALQKIARRRGVVVVASLFEKRAPGLYHNTAVVVDADGALLGCYRKMHVPDDPLYFEKFYFTPGDLGFRAWTTRFAKIGALVCWDQWYPEAARLTALRGAEILFYPTAIGWHPSEKAESGARQRDAWETVQRGHAVANGCFVAVANRVGRERPAGGDGLEFWGQSFVAGVSGEILQRASAGDEEIVLAELDLTQVETARRHWPFFRDRRIDAYGDLTRRFIDGAPGEE